MTGRVTIHRPITREQIEKEWEDRSPSINHLIYESPKYYLRKVLEPDKVLQGPYKVYLLGGAHLSLDR